MGSDVARRAAHRTAESYGQLGGLQSMRMRHDLSGQFGICVMICLTADAQHWHNSGTTRNLQSVSELLREVHIWHQYL